MLILSTNSFASFELSGVGARARSMGSAYVGLANTSDAIFTNCAGLARIAQPTTSLFYVHPFGMKELSYGSMSAVIPTSFSNLSLGVISFGNKFYQEQSFYLSIARSIHENIYIGTNLHYMKLQINGYGSNFSIGWDIGILAALTEKLYWGGFVTNVNRPRIGEVKESLPQTFTSGFTFMPFENTVLNLDIFKELSFKPDIRFGFEYKMLQRIFLRSGFSTEPSQYCGGIGFLFSFFQIDYAVTTHLDLGLTHQFSLQLSFGKNKTQIRTIEDSPHISAHEIKKIDINKATLNDLLKIKGIGPTLAGRILAYRESIIKFKTYEDLLQVKGIGKSKLEQIKPYITIDE